MSRLSFKSKTLIHPVVALTVAIIGCGMLTGCGTDSLPAYSEFIDIDPELWEPGAPAELSPWPRDSVTDRYPFRLDLAVRYTRSAPDTLRLAVTRIALDVAEHTDTLSIPLLSPDDTPAGRGSFGFYTVGTTLAESIRLPEGLIISAVPLVPVRGIASVGLVLTPDKEN